MDRLCTALLAGLSQLDENQEYELLQQMQLMLSVPDLRARLWESQLANQQAILDAFESAERSFDLEVTINAVYAASTTALIAWASGNASQRLSAVLTRAFTALRQL